MEEETKRNSEIRYPICNCGKAMVSTFAFRSQEYWCWNCGYTDEFFVAVKRRAISDEEYEELEQKRAEAGDFLHAHGCMYGGGMIKVDGEIISFDEFPKDMKEKLKKDVKSWIYEDKRVRS